MLNHVLIFSSAWISFEELKKILIAVEGSIFDCSSIFQVRNVAKEDLVKQPSSLGPKNSQGLVELQRLLCVFSHKPRTFDWKDG